MEPLSRGFRTLQSGMSSLARFRFLPPVGWAGLGGGWAGGKQGSRQEITREPQVRAGHPRDPLPWEGAGPGPVPLSVPRVRVSVSSWVSTLYAQARASYPENHHLSWQRFLPFSKLRF